MIISTLATKKLKLNSLIRIGFVISIFMLSITANAQTYFTEGFEAQFTPNTAAGPNAPVGWTQTRLGTLTTQPTGSTTDGAKDWAQQTKGATWASNTLPNSAYAPKGTVPATAYEGNGVAWFNDYYCAGSGTSGQNIRRLESPLIDLSASTAPGVTFSYAYNSGTASIALVASKDGGTTWDNLGTYSSFGTGWKNQMVFLPAAYKVANAKVGFVVTNAWGSHDLFLDAVYVKELVAANISSTSTGGNWSAPATWAGGVVPSSLDNVTIVDGSTVSIDVSPTVSTLTVGSGSGSAAVLQNNNVATATNLTVTGNVTINSNGTIKSGASATIVNTLSIGGDFAINGAGTFNALTSTTNKLDLIFTGGTNNSFTTSATSNTTFDIVTMNKALNAVLNFNPGKIYTSGATQGFLITSGILQISGTTTISDKVFITTGYTIAANGGFWLNNPNFTVLGQTGSPTNLGLLRISSGTFNVGNSTGNSIIGATGQYEILGGVLNIAGRLSCSGAGKYTQTGGVVNITTIGNAASNSPGFEFSSTSSITNISGGEINLVQASTGGTPNDFRISSTSPVFTGGILNVGTAATATNFNFRIAGPIPEMLVRNNATATFYAASTLYRNVTINSGSTVDLNGYGVTSFRNIINNGTLKGSTTSSKLTFSGAIAQVYSGSGTVATGFLLFELNNVAGLTFSSTNTFGVQRINLFAGGITNADKITLGFGTSTLSVIQIGNSTTPTDAGYFDVSPTYNLGTGGQTLLSLRTVSPRTLGNSLNPSRALVGFTFDDNVNNLTITGGDITVTGILTLTNGQIINGANAINVTGTTVGSIVRTNGYVNGKLSRVLPASYSTASTYVFPIGKSTYNPFELVNPKTSAGGTVTIMAEAFDANSGGTAGSGVGSISTTKYWSASITNGAANFTNSQIRLNDTRGSFDAIASSSTQAGSYNITGGYPATLTTTSITSLAASPLTTLPGYFLMATAVTPEITNVVITPAGTQCTNVARTVTATVTPGGNAITSVEIKYKVNGGTEVVVAMTNTSGNNWSGTIPTVTPSNGTVTWNIVVTDAGALTKTFAGTSYSDEPLTGVSASASATPSAICAGSPVTLNAKYFKPGLVSLGAGATTSLSPAISPYYHGYGGVKSQFIIRGSELTTAGFIAGNLSSVAFEITSLGTTTLNGFAISMGNTLQTAAVTNAAISGLTPVYSNAAQTLTTGVNTYNFSTPFYWDGNSNIVVSVCYSNSNGGGTSSTVKADVLSYTSSMAIYADNKTSAIVCGANNVADFGGGTTSNTTSSTRPRMTFTGNSSYTPTGTVNYSWSDGSTIVGSTNDLVVSPTSNKTYTATITFDNGCSLTSSSASVTTTPLPAGVTGSTPSTQCGIGVPDIFVTGGTMGNYRWYLQATGGTAIAGETNSAFSSYSISATTTFYAAITNGTCESARTAVTATVNTPDAITATAPANGCLNSSIALSAVQTGTTQTYTYTWTATPEAGSGITGSVTGQTINVTPTVAGTFVYNVNAVSGSCTTASSVSVNVVNLPLVTASASPSTPVCVGTSVNLLAQTTTYAPTSATLGAGLTSTNSAGSPFYASYGGYKYNYIFTKAELNAAGLTAGSISSLSLDVTVAPTFIYKSFAIGIAATSETGFASGASLMLPTSNVFNGSLANNGYSPTVGINTFNFSTPFNWNGTSNVVVSFCYSNNDGGAFSSGSTVKMDNYPNKTLELHGDTKTAAVLCSATTTSTGISSSIPTLRPQMKFVGIGETMGAGNLNWSWNPGSLTGNAISVTPATTTTYTVTGTNPVTGCSNTAAIEVVVKQIPEAPIAEDGEHCGTAISTANVTTGGVDGSGIFNWFDAATGGTLVQTGTSATYLEPIGVSTTFYVSETGANGCESSRTPLTIAVIEADPITLTATAATSCVNSEVVLEITQAGEGNTYEFTYSASPLEGSGIIGDESGTTASVFPTAPGTYEYSVTGFDGDRGCSAFATATITIKTPPTITSVSATPSTICAGAPTTLKVKNVQGGAGSKVVGAGANTTSTNGSPFYSLWGGYKTQYIYSAAELTALGVLPGNITSLSLDVVAVPAGTYKGFAIGIGSTLLTEFNATTPTAVSTTNVFNGSGVDNAFIPTASSTNTFNFSTPFNWDGTSNIVVSICYSNNDGGSGAGDASVKTDTYSTNTTMVIYGDNKTVSVICGATTKNDLGTVSAYSTTVKIRPRTTFGAQVGVDNTNLATYSWTPGGATGSTVTVNPTTTTTYTVTATDTYGCSSTANVLVNVTPLPEAPVASNSTQCGNGVPTASVTGTGTFLWYNAATGGSIVQTGGSTFAGSISTTTTFYVSATNGGCEGPRSGVVATVNQPDAITATATSTSVCEGNGTTLGVNQSGTNQTYTYTWTATPSVGSGLVNGSTGATQSINPTSFGSYTYNVVAFDANGSCSTSSSIVVTYNANPLITAATATPSSVCSGGSTILKAESIQSGNGTASLGAGANTVSSLGSPFYSSYGGYKYQYIYTKAELSAMGILAGNITSLSLEVVSVPAGTYKGFAIGIANTSLSAFATASAVPTTTVFTGPLANNAYNPTVGVNTFNFTTPFNWNGTSNIVVSFCYSNNDDGSAAGDASVKTDTYTTNTTLYLYSDYVTPATMCSAVTDATLDFDYYGSGFNKIRPKTTFAGNVGVDNTNLSTYTWTPGGATGSSITVNPTSTITYSVVATNILSGCVSSASTVVVTVVPVGASASASVATLCAGGSSTLSANATGGAPFTYSWSDGASVLGTSATQNVTPATTTTYTVTVKDACNNETTSQVTVTVNPLPTISIAEAGPITLCSPATQTLTANSNASSPSYQWKKGGVAIGGANGSTYSATESGSYSVTVTDGSTTCSNTSATFVLTVNPSPSAVVMTPSEITICEGSSTSLNAGSLVQSSGTIGTGVVGNTASTPYRGGYGGTRTQFLYTKAELTTMGMVGGSSVNSLAMKLTAFTSPYTFNDFKIAMKNTTTSTLTATLESGATTVFGPLNYTLNAPSLPYVITHNLTTPFVWDGTSNILIEFCFNNNNSGLSSAYGDVTSTTITGRVSYKSIDNSTAVCTTTAGGTSTSRPNMTFGYNFAAPITWSPAIGLSATSGNTVTANPTATTTYTATATNSFGCTSSSTVTVNVSPTLQVGAAISGPINACVYMGNGSQLATYSVAVQNSSAIIWTLPSGAINVTGQGTNTISFNYPMSFTSGNVSVEVSPLAPCVTKLTRTLAIGRTVPSAPVVSGIVNVCNYVGTGLELTYTVAPDPNVSSYTWSVGPQVTIVSGQGTGSINVKLAAGFLSSPASTQIRVTGNASCGASDLAIFFITAKLPETAGQIAGPTELCSYVGTSTQVTYQIASVPFTTSYLWTVPTGATIVGSNTGSSINVVYSNGFTGGNVSVRAVNSCGTSSARSLPVKRTAPSMPGLVSGPKNVCLFLPTTTNPSGTTGIYSVPSQPGVTYIWNVPAGIVIESHSNTSTEDAITVSFNSSYSGGSIGVSASSECGISAERVLNLAQLTPGAVGGILQLSAGDCQDRTYVYGVASMPSNASSLQWTVPTGGTIISGQGTTTITVLYPGTALSGLISAIGENGCGQSSRAREFTVKLGACAPQDPQVKSGIKSTPFVDVVTGKLEVNVYPNPSTTTFKLNATSSNLNEVMHVRIVDNLGREFKRLQMKSGETISFGSELKAGSYFVEVMQGKEKAVKKVLKF